MDIALKANAGEEYRSEYSGENLKAHRMRSNEEIGKILSTRREEQKKELGLDPNCSFEEYYKATIMLDTDEKIQRALEESEEDFKAGRTFTQEEVENYMKSKFK